MRKSEHKPHEYNLIQSFQETPHEIAEPVVIESLHNEVRDASVDKFAE